MPEDMSDRMPEDLPVTKRINVMVGIFCALFFVVCIVVFLCFFSGMNCDFFGVFWSELCFVCAFLSGMNCVLFLCFFCGRNCVFCFCFFSGMNCDFFGVFLVWIVCFLCFFLCSGAPEKHKKKQQTKHNKISISLKKMKLRPPDLDSLRTSGPANVSHHFLFPTSFPKESLRSEPMPGAGMWKNVIIYHMMSIEDLNSYCWRHAFVTLLT